MAPVLSHAVLEDETEQELYLNHRNSEGRVPGNQENWNIVTQIPVLVNFFHKECRISNDYNIMLHELL